MEKRMGELYDLYQAVSGLGSWRGAMGADDVVSVAEIKWEACGAVFPAGKRIGREGKKETGSRKRRKSETRQLRYREARRDGEWRGPGCGMATGMWSV